MADEKLLTVRDVSIILGTSEKEVVELAESGAIPAYKVGGVYLRFKHSQVMEFKKSHHLFSAKPDTSHSYSFGDRLSDFFYFNDFYVLAGLIILILLVLILRG